MASTSETGHAKNIANFQDLISFCQGYSVTYNPSKDSLKIDQLKNLYDQSLQKLDLSKAQKTTFNKATNDRKNEFTNIKPLSTKVINAFSVSGVDALSINNLKSVNKKIQGTSAKKIGDTQQSPPNNTTTPSTTTLDMPTKKSISTSQQSYDSVINHFDSMLQILQQHTMYLPNEEELKTGTLQLKLANMKAANTTLINAYTEYNNALIARNQILYNPLTGLVQTAQEVKKYVKSIFGATSPQFKQVNGLEFKTLKGE